MSKRIQPPIVALLLGCALPVWAESEQTGFHREPYPLSLRASDDAPVQTEQVFAQTIEVSGTPLLRVHFGDYSLGAESYIALTSAQDGGYQVLNAETLPQWSNSSAIFNGDTVQVELHIAQGETGIYVDIAEVTVVDPDRTGDPGGSDTVARSICGDYDNRVPSNDPRAGRLFFGGCTGWLISNGAALTAGHCGKPDGDLSGVIMEFNVPPTLPANHRAT